MAITKRLNTEERFAQRYGANWRNLLKFPMIAAMCNPHSASHYDASAENIQNVLNRFAEGRWITAMPMDDKIFIYLCCKVMNRVSPPMPMFLPKPTFDQLERHMSAQTTQDKIDNMDGVSFAMRQAYVWDLPQFLDRYSGAARVILRDDFKKPIKRVKLPHHRTK